MKNPISFRPVEERDLGWLLELRERVRVFLGDNDIPGYETQRAWFDRVRSDRTVRYFAIESSERKETDQRVGMARITHIDFVNRSACVGGDIHPDFRRCGYGTAMMEEIKRYCFYVLNLRRLWLLVLSTNAPAQRLYEKTGFRREGVQREAIWREGRYVDYVMMSLIRKETE